MKKYVLLTSCGGTKLKTSKSIAPLFKYIQNVVNITYFKNQKIEYMLKSVNEFGNWEHICNFTIISTGEGLNTKSF